MIAAPTPPRAHTSQCSTPGALSLTKDLIATANHQHTLLSTIHKSTTYCSPSPVACNPENNVCKVITYRGEKVAAFNVEGRELICLPQAFELFLKHLVGGLHTVYTKLKRLDITPVVCNVEQVRILRGLGAIQPGVNRCKLISCKEFDILYEDCTNSSARPGRPPKRSPSLHANPETIEKLKKCKMDGEYSFDPRMYDRKSFLNGFTYNPYAMSHLPFMPMNPINMFTQPGSMSSLTPHMTSRPENFGSVESHKSPINMISPSTKYEALESIGRRLQDRVVGSNYDGNEATYSSDEDDNRPLNLHINGRMRESSQDKHQNQPFNNDDDVSSDENGEDEYNNFERDKQRHTLNNTQSFNSSPQNGDGHGVTSVETLLLNIQRLVEVATENARRHEQQLNIEKAELKTELSKSRKMREQLEQDLKHEKRSKESLIRKLKQEKRARKKLQRLNVTPKEQNNKSDSDEKASSFSSDSDDESTDTVNKVQEDVRRQDDSLKKESFLEKTIAPRDDTFPLIQKRCTGDLKSLTNDTKMFPYPNLVNGSV